MANQSEALIQDTIRNIAYNRTVIIIAHRLSTVVGAHRIVVLDKGRVVEEGTHARFLNRGGVYAAFYSKELV